MTLDKCCCSDPACPVHIGTSCNDVADSYLYWIGMADQSAMPFCASCADDALASGVFDIAEIDAEA